MNVDLFKASPFGDQTTEGATILIHAEIPEQKQLGLAAALYRSEATRLHDALISSLPGGTYDQLLALMHQKKASLFQVAYAALNRAAKGEDHD